MNNKMLVAFLYDLIRIVIDMYWNSKTFNVKDAEKLEMWKSKIRDIYEE